MKQIFIFLFLLGFTFTLQAKELHPKEAELQMIAKELGDFFLKGNQKETSKKFKVLFGTDAELKAIYGKHAKAAIKNRDSFLQTAGTPHYWKLHTELLRKSGEIRKVQVFKNLNVYTKQMIDKKFISPGTAVLHAGWIDKNGKWDSFEFAWVNKRWVMLSPSAFEIMTNPEKYK